mgnify:CR=1 FL=1
MLSPPSESPVFETVIPDSDAVTFEADIEFWSFVVEVYSPSVMFSLSLSSFEDEYDALLFSLLLNVKFAFVELLFKKYFLVSFKSIKVSKLVERIVINKYVDSKEEKTLCLK